MVDALKDVGVARLTEYFEYLDGLRESGATNMFGAGRYLMMEYPGMAKTKANVVLAAWMETFEDGPTAEFRASKVVGG